MNQNHGTGPFTCEKPGQAVTAVGQTGLSGLPETPLLRKSLRAWSFSVISGDRTRVGFRPVTARGSDGRVLTWPGVNEIRGMHARSAIRPDEFVTFASSQSRRTPYVYRRERRWEA